MAVKNSTILEKAWLEGTNDFQQRIPNPAIAGYARTVSELFAPYNADLFNAFTMLLNGINQTYVESKRFTNPLRVLLKPSIRFGATERHVATRYLQAHSARPDTETLLKLELPEYREWFYSVSEPRRYEFSWPRYELERAFAEPDGYGYNDLLNATIDQMISSNEYDQMNIMIQMFAEADNRLGGLYRENLTQAPTSEAGARELLQKIRAVAGRMKFPTMLYNHIDIPVHENGETLILWVTPEAMSFIDVYGLATVFQLDKAEIQYRIIQIPEFPIPNVYAALTSEDFIYAREVGYGIEPPFYDPSKRAYKYYLFDAEMIGINPVANCVLFTTDNQTTIPTITMEPESMNFVDSSGSTLEALTVSPGGVYQLKLELAGAVFDENGEDITNTSIAVEPDAATFTVAGGTLDTSGDDPVTVPKELNSRTFVDDYGRLHVQKTGLTAGTADAPADIITVTANSVYINPGPLQQDEPGPFTATLQCLVVDAAQRGAKECPVEEEPFIEYTDETEIVSASE